MKKRNSAIILLISLSMLISSSLSVKAQNLEDYGVAPGDAFTYKVVTTVEEESTIDFMKFRIITTSTVVGLTADFEYYDGTETIETDDIPCNLVYSQSEIQAYRDDGIQEAEQYYGSLFVSVMIIPEDPNYDAIWVDTETGVAVKVWGTNEDGNPYTYQLVQWGEGQLQVLYEAAYYERQGGGGDLPGYPMMILGLISAASLILIIRKTRN